MSVVLTYPQSEIEKKGNIYLTVSKQTNINRTLAIFIRLGVCTEADSYSKYGYAIRAFNNAMSSRVYCGQDEELDKRVYTIIQHYYCPTYIKGELLETPKNFGYSWDLSIKFKVITGFIISYDEKKTVLENAFACHIARLCKEAIGDIQYYLISNYASRCKPVVYNQVSEWLKSRNINTIQEFISWVDAFTPECKDSFDQYKFA